MEIDHIFMLINPQEDDVKNLQSLGLVETYRRQHPGQGTQNMCFCFDNLFVELLWINDAADVRSEKIARTKLYERSRWRLDGTNRFGIAWRGQMGGGEPRIPTWKFCPPYLPAAVGIDVAIDSDNPYQPMMFESPGGTPPSDWPVEKKGALQQAGGWGQVLGIDLFLPRSVMPSQSLRSIASQTSLNLKVASDNQFSMNLHIEKRGSPQPSVLKLPT